MAVKQKDPIADLESALGRLPPRPWHTEISKPSVYQERGYMIRPGMDDLEPQRGFEVGALRAVDNRNVVEPWPESASMIIGVPGTLQAIVDLANAAQAIIDAKNDQ